MLKHIDEISITQLKVLRETEDNVMIYTPNDTKRRKKTIHKVIASKSQPRVNIVNGTVLSSITNFLNTVATIENSEIQYEILSRQSEKELSERIDNLIQNGNYQIIINSVTTGNLKKPNLFNYEEKGFCSVVPILSDNVVKNEFFVNVRYI